MFVAVAFAVSVIVLSSSFRGRWRREPERLPPSSFEHGVGPPQELSLLPREEGKSPAALAQEVDGC